MDKREQLVRVAFDLFYREGVHAVGINRVLAESGVAKKTLYHHFPGKDDLLAATVGYRDALFVEWLAERLVCVPAGRDALLALFDALDDWFHGRDDRILPFHGCYFINVSAEYGDPTHPVHIQCARHKAAVRAIIEPHVEKVASSNIEREALLDAVCLLKEGAIVRAHVESNGDAAREARQVLARLMAV